MRRVLGGAGVILLAGVAAAGCKNGGGGEGGRPNPGDDAGPDTAADRATAPGGLLTDPSVPRCLAGPGLGDDVELHGLLDDQRIDDATFLFTNMDPSSFQVFEVVDAAVRFDLVLNWNQPLAENRSISLTGGSMIMREGQPFATQSFCITAGEFGSPALAASDPGRTLLYRITGARRGDCAGPEVPVSLAGCSFRTNTYFPIASVDAGAEGGAALDAPSDRLVASDASGTCSATAPSDAGAACNEYPLTGAILGTKLLAVDDAGTVGSPAGGAVVDGDYDLVDWSSVSVNYSRRNIHIFNGGTRIEWVAELDGSSPMMVIRANTRTSFSGNLLTIAAVDCAAVGVFQTPSYGYTATGDDLVLYNTDVSSGTLANVYTYRRRCTRGR